MLGVKSGEQGDKSVSLMRVVPKPSHAVCFRSWANSDNTRVCVSEQSGVQTGARRVSKNTRVCGVFNKGKEGGGLAPAPRSLSSVLHASRTVCYPPGHIHRTHSSYLPRDTHYEGITTARRRRRKVWPTEIFQPPILPTRMGKHADRRPRGSVCAPVTTPACAVPAEILGGGCELCEFNTS